MFELLVHTCPTMLMGHDHLPCCIPLVRWTFVLRHWGDWPAHWGKPSAPTGRKRGNIRVGGRGQGPGDGYGIPDTAHVRGRWGTCNVANFPIEPLGVI